MSNDGTLGGYLDIHDRPPAFEGADGAAYSAALLVDDKPNEDGEYGGAVLFVRWSSSGDSPVGHLETPYLVQCRTATEAGEKLRGLTLHDVKVHLDHAIAASKERPDW